MRTHERDTYELVTVQTEKGGMRMLDREKVIKEFELFIKEYHPACTSEGVELDMFMEVLSLLKEQKAVKPLREHSGGGTTWWNVCGACRTAINPNDKYCHECGRAVKWE